MNDAIGRFLEWVNAHKDRVYGCLVYRRLFTPYEQKQAFMDESEFTDIHFRYVRIEEAVPLGGGDWLLGLRILDEDMDDCDEELEFHRLSDVKLFTYDWMQKKFAEEESDEPGAETKAG